MRSNRRSGDAHVAVKARVETRDRGFDISHRRSVPSIRRGRGRDANETQRNRRRAELGIVGGGRRGAVGKFNRSRGIRAHQARPGAVHIRGRSPLRRVRPGRRRVRVEGAGSMNRRPERASGTRCNSTLHS